MNHVKHSITVGDNGQRYRAPESQVLLVKTLKVLCQSPGNEPMRENDYGDGGFETGY